MSDKIIFLDIDGVLCTQRTVYASEAAMWRELDTVAIRMLNKIALKTSAKFVLSSTWRKLQNDPTFLHTCGFIGQFHRDWRTGNSSSGFRGREVAEWLREHEGEWERYAILDDSTDFYDYMLPVFVRTCTDNGLLAEHYVKLLALLESKEPISSTFPPPAIISKSGEPIRATTPTTVNKPKEAGITSRLAESTSNFFQTDTGSGYIPFFCN
jgi:hypothetical protein